MTRVDDDAVHVDRQEVLVIESPPHQLGERRLTGVDELARDAAPGDADGAGRLGQDLGISARRHAHDHDLVHALGEPRILVQLLVGGDRHFAPAPTPKVRSRTQELPVCRCRRSCQRKPLLSGPNLQGRWRRSISIRYPAVPAPSSRVGRRRLRRGNALVHARRTTLSRSLLFPPLSDRRR